MHITALFVLFVQWNAPTHAQTPTYQDQAAYYELNDPAATSVAIESGSTSEALNTEVDNPYRNYSPTTYSPTPYYSPIVYVGNYGGGSESSTTDESINFIRLTDDINESGVPGAAVILVQGPDGSYAPTVLTDFDDLHTFNVAFDQVSVAQQSGFRSYEATAVYWMYEEENDSTNAEQVAAQRTEAAVSNLQLDPPTVRRGTDSRAIYVRAPTRSQLLPQFSKYAQDRRGGGIGLSYGYKEFGLFDRFRFDAEGGIIGRTFSDTRTNNWVTGPHAGIVAFKSLGPIKLYAHGLAVAGMNDADMLQNNGIGAEYVPGATNRLLYARPTYSENQAAYDVFTPAGIFWSEAGLQITDNSSFRFAWSAVFADNVLLAEDRVRYYLPSMGFRDPGNQDFIQQLFFCGVEVVR